MARVIPRRYMRRLAERVPSARSQLGVLTGQLLAGAGNLAFALLMARLLPPDAFARLVAFLAIYTLVHLFAGSFSAAGALVPHDADRLRPRLWTIGVFGALALVAVRGVVAGVVGIPEDLVLALALALPAAGVLAVQRGTLYGTGSYRQVVASLLAEPAVRLAVGAPLAVVASAGGAATGVAAAGWVALTVVLPAELAPRLARVRDRWLSRASLLTPARSPSPADGAGIDATTGRSGAVTFVLLALFMNVDLLLANRLLVTGEAARFAVLSTLGGVAVFATTTVPLVLMGESRRRGAFPTALALTMAVGGAVVTAAWAAPELVVGAIFGERYLDVAPLAAPYMAAMALFSVARVVAADLSARGMWLPAPVVAIVVVAQSGVIVAVAETAGGVVGVTLGATGACVVVLWAIRWLSTDRSLAPEPAPAPPEPAPAPPEPAPAPPEPAPEPAWRVRYKRVAVLVGGLTLFGLVVRLVAPRSVWLDEAIAVSQAEQDFGSLIESLRYGDVHPPLHSAVLWVTVRLLGTSELAIRFPSMIAGALLIPVLYLAARELYDRRTGLTAAALGTIAPFLVWYSQEARMYAFMALFGLLAVYGQFRCIRRGRPQDWALYALATAALLWTQYFAALQVVVQLGIFGAVFWQRRRSREEGIRLFVGLVAAVAVIVVLLIPLEPILRDQIVAYGNRGGAGLQQVPRAAGADVEADPRLSLYAIAANFVWALWGYHSDRVMSLIVALWPLVMLLFLFFLGRRQARSTSFLAAVALGTVACFVALGLVRRDLFELRYFAGVVPILVILAAHLLNAGFAGRVGRTVAIGVVLLTFAVGLVDQQVNGANPRIYDFRGTLHTVSRMAAPDDVVYYAPRYLEPVMDYYAPGLRARPLDEGGDIEPASPFGRVVVIGSFLDKREVSGRIGTALGRLDHSYELVDEFESRNVRVWVFR